MVKADLSGCLTDPNYCPLRAETIDRLKLDPHRALYHNTDRRLLVLLKQSSGGDFSANADMIKSLCELQSADKIAVGYLVQIVNDEEGEPRVLASETAQNVAKKTNGIVPREGERGPYFWLKEFTFSVARSGSNSWADNELPF